MRRYKLTENRLRGMIREAVAGYLNEIETAGGVYYNPDTGTYGNEREIRTGRGNTFRLDKNDPRDRFDLEKDPRNNNRNNNGFNLQKDPRNNNRFNLQKESRLRGMIREAVKNALNEVMAINEYGKTEDGQRKLGRLTTRQLSQGRVKDSCDTYAYALRNHEFNDKLRKAYKQGQDEYPVDWDNV